MVMRPGIKKSKILHAQDFSIDSQIDF